jgi:murein DD-endopeptidase MepM/ murein hydrolase activator NlpD
MIGRSFKLDSKTKLKDRLKNMSKSLFSRHEGRFVKAAAAALLLTTLTYNFAFAKEDSASLNKIYHVYYGEQYIGAVTSEKKVDELITEKEEAASTQYKELSVDAGSNVKILPELVFKSEVNSEETLEKLNDSIIVQATAYKVTVNGETVAYLKNAAEFDQMINQLKLQYVSQEQLDELNARQLTTEQLPPLSVNETRILEISVTADIQGEEAVALPEEVLTVDQALQTLTTGTAEQIAYTVQEGDVLGSIASAHGLSTAELVAANPGFTEETVLKIGQQLNVTATKPLASVSVVYETLQEETIPFTSVTKDDLTMLKGEKKTVQAGANGLKHTQYQTIWVNGTQVQAVNVGETVVTNPTEEIIHKGTKVVSSQGTGSFVWPTNGGYVSSKMGARWGRQHRGIDIARPSNYTIKAADNGKVVSAGWDGTYGNKVVINHNNGLQTVYAHLSSISVSVGQTVQAGASIGVMGRTGNSTGVHLHFEVLKNGAHVNPLSYLK